MYNNAKAVFVVLEIKNKIELDACTVRNTYTLSDFTYPCRIWIGYRRSCAPAGCCQKHFKYIDDTKKLGLLLTIVKTHTMSSYYCYNLYIDLSKINIE